MSEFAVLMRVLLVRASLSGALEEVQVHRKAGYAFVDALGFFVALSCWDRHGAIKEFSRVSHADGLGEKLAGIVGRRAWPRDSSMSRLLKSVRKQDVEQFRKHVLPLVEPGLLANSPFAMCRDARGQPWGVFDLDGIVRAFRQRALPAGADLPEAQRWTDEIAAPGYPGRKRGETQVSGHRLQQAGSSLWLGQDIVAGNTVMSEATAEVVPWLLQFCELAGLDREHAVIRMDGAGGNTECIGALHAAGIHFLVRWPYYEPLDWPAVRLHLRGEVWAPVCSSRAEVQRHAAELGTGRWLSGARQLPAGTRLVASRFLSAEQGKQRGAGHLIGPAQYELYATDLDAGAWPAEDAVSFYFGRAAHENNLARGNEELGLKRMFCKVNRQGQNLAQMILMLVWNLETTLGTQLLALPDERPLQAPRPPRQLRSFEDVPVVDAPAPALPGEVHPTTLPPSAPPATNAPSPTTPIIAEQQMTREQACELLRAEVVKRPGWSVNEQCLLTCPAGARTFLHRLLPAANDHTQLQFRAPRRACAQCPCRSGCTSSTALTFQKTLMVTVAGAFPRPKKTPALQPNPVPRPAESGAQVWTPWTPPLPATIGLLLPDGPAVVPADLRTAFQRACEGVVVRVLLPAAAQRRDQPHHIVATAAQRQRRRHTHQERRAWNALPSGARPTMTLLRAGPVASILPVDTRPAKAA